jgi:hypothetical protein
LWRCGDGLFFGVPTLASDAFLTTLHPLLENMLQTVDHTLKVSCLDAYFSWLEKPRNLMGRDLDCMMYVLMGFHRSTFSKPNTGLNSDFAPMQFLGPRKGSSEAISFEVIIGLQQVFEKWVERCKKCVTYQGRYFEKETVTAPPQSSDSEW